MHFYISVRTKLSLLLVMVQAPVALAGDNAAGTFKENAKLLVEAPPFYPSILLLAAAGGTSRESLEAMHDDLLKRQMDPATTPKISLKSDKIMTGEIESGLKLQSYDPLTLSLNGRTWSPHNDSSIADDYFAVMKFLDSSAKPKAVSSHPFLPTANAQSLESDIENQKNLGRRLGMVLGALVVFSKMNALKWKKQAAYERLERLYRHQGQTGLAQGVGNFAVDSRMGWNILAYGSSILGALSGDKIGEKLGEILGYVGGRANQEIAKRQLTKLLSASHPVKCTPDSMVIEPFGPEVGGLVVRPNDIVTFRNKDGKNLSGYLSGMTAQTLKLLARSCKSEADSAKLNQALAQNAQLVTQIVTGERKRKDPQDSIAPIEPATGQK